jgi:DNA repair protein RadD
MLALSLKKHGSDFDMDAAAALMDIEPVTERVVQEWFDLAKERKTIGFATNVAHAKHMTEAFKTAGAGSGRSARLMVRRASKPPQT